MRFVYQSYLLLVSGIYFIWQWRHGHTLPMKTWHIRVVTMCGEPVSFRQATVRFLIATLGLLLMGIGFLWAVVDSERQFLHDRVGGTRLISD
jgi:uncharacterized RDD family membrane protein YckC